MDRNQYLLLCRQYSVIPKGIHGQPEGEYPDLLVVYQGREYYPIDYTLGYDNGEIRHTAGLREKRANCYIGAPLAQVERKSEAPA